MLLLLSMHPCLRLALLPLRHFHDSFFVFVTGCRFASTFDCHIFFVPSKEDFLAVLTVEGDMNSVLFLVL